MPAMGSLASLLTSIIRSVVALFRSRGEPVKISSFGRFVVRGKRARKGRNPHTGAEILLEARRVVTFRPSQTLKKLLNDADAWRAGQ